MEKENNNNKIKIIQLQKADRNIIDIGDMALNIVQLLILYYRGQILFCEEMEEIGRNGRD